MVRLVLFDIDGTLVHTGRAGSRAFGKTAASVFRAPENVEHISFGGRTDPSLVRELFKLNDISATPENFRRFFESYVFWLDHLVANTTGQICRGVTDFIRDLQALPEPPVLGLLTGNIRLGAEIKLRRYGLWELFETGGFADDSEDRNHIAAAAFERGRRVLAPWNRSSQNETTDNPAYSTGLAPWSNAPQNATIETAAYSTGRDGDLRPDEILVVGDTPHDVRCGKFIGAKVLAVATGRSTLEELKHHKPDWAVEDLTRISVREICGRDGVSPSLNEEK